MSIELRLSDVDPPAPDPPRTIYRDVVNLPSPVYLGITIRYFNHDDVGLYFQITGSAPGYTFGTVNLGSLGAGANAYRNLDNFASRAKPVAGDFTEGEFEESITLILRAYTDAGYTDLKWTYERSVTVRWIKSDDPAFTVDFLNNFDDGTPQTWACTLLEGSVCEVAVVTDFVLSAPYSLRMRVGTGTVFWNGRLYKSFTTPNKDTVYAIFDVRLGGSRTAYLCTIWLKFFRDTVLLVHLGKAAVEAGYPKLVPINKWMRVVVPLPKNVTVELRAEFRSNSGASPQYEYLWLDDFKIISK